MIDSSYFEAQLGMAEEYESTIKYDELRGGYVPTSNEEVVDVFEINREQYYKLCGYEGNREREVQLQIDPNLEKNEQIRAFSPDRQTLLARKVSKVNSKPEIPKGNYRLDLERDGPILKPMVFSMDDYIPLRSNKGNIVRNLLTEFKNSRELCKKEGYEHTERILLYGPPGNGKTMEVYNILKNTKNDGFHSIFIPSSVDIDDVTSFKSGFDEDNDVIFIIEELTERIKGNRTLEEVLSFLDGESSWNHSFVIATTNYPGDLPENIADRPGRFSELIEFPNPSTEERVNYLNNKGFSEEKSREIAHKFKDYSLDYLVNAVKKYKIFDKDPSEYIKDAEKMRKQFQTEREKYKRMGI